MMESAVNRILKRMWNCRGKQTATIDKVKMETIIREELSAYPERSVLDDVQSDIEDTRKQSLVDLLKNMPFQTIQIAYLYAKNYIDYGEDVTKTWITATQNACALEKAYTKGCHDALQRQTEGSDKVEIIEQLENAIKLIKQDGKDWLDDRDIPILETCIRSLTTLDKIEAVIAERSDKG